MGVPPDTVWDLCVRTDVEPRLRAETTLGPNGRYEFCRISPDAVEEFWRSYRTTAQIAAALDGERKK